MRAGEEMRATEETHPASEELDRLSLDAAFDLFDAQDRTLAACVADAKPTILRTVEWATAALRAGGRLFYVGAGSSGRLGALDAAECPPTFQSDPMQVQAILAGGKRAMYEAVEGAEDSTDEARAAIEQHEVGRHDVVLGISASGGAPFVQAALSCARERGAHTILLTCVPASQVTTQAELVLSVVTGAELLTGSTRLRAGTVTKLVLNRISTLVMTRLGKVYRNLMVDVNTRGNAKLAARGVRIVVAVTGLAPDAAAALLARADGGVKRACVMHARAMDPRGADALLARHGGFLRAALGAG